MSNKEPQVCGKQAPGQEDSVGFNLPPQAGVSLTQNGTPAPRSGNGGLTPSSRSNPCPICGRNDDGDCRISKDFVLCHYGSDFRPPPWAVREGDSGPGADGQTWALVGKTADGRCGEFRLDRPLPSRNGSAPIRVAQPRPTQPAAAPADSEPIYLLRLVGGPESEGDHVLRFYSYGPDLQVERKQGHDGKKLFLPQHRADGGWVRKAGINPWPAFGQADAVAAAIAAAIDAWVLDIEGEGCCTIARQGGVAAITQPGHAHGVEQIAARYAALKKAGVIGVVFLQDHDAQGRKRAIEAMEAAAKVGLRFLLLEAAAVWPDMPVGGSIDDAPGTPAERIEAIERALAAGLAVTGEAKPAKPAEEGERAATFSELVATTLDAVAQGDIDMEMVCRAELKTRFRQTDQQIERQLIDQHIGRRIEPVQKRGPGVDLSLIAPLSYRMPGWPVVGDCQTTYGPMGTGKTTLCLAKAIALAEGLSFLDREEPCQPGNSLIIATDSGGASLNKSFADLGIDPSTHPLFSGLTQRIWIWTHAPAQGHAAWVCNIRGIVELEKFIIEFNIDYVAIDSAKSVASGADWSYTDNESVKRVLRYLREGVASPTGCTLEIINHDGTVKGSQAGAKAWIEDPSMVMALSIVEDNGRQIGVEVVFRKDRAARSNPRRTVRYTLEDGVLELLPGTEVAGNCSEALLTILRNTHQRGIGGGLSTADLVREACTRFGKTQKTVENTIPELLADRRVVRVRRGMYALSPGEIQRSAPPLPPQRGVAGAEPLPQQAEVNPPTLPPGGFIGGKGACAEPPDNPLGGNAGGSYKVSHSKQFPYKTPRLVGMGGVSPSDSPSGGAALPPGDSLRPGSPPPGPSSAGHSTPSAIGTDQATPITPRMPKVKGLTREATASAPPAEEAGLPSAGAEQDPLPDLAAPAGAPVDSTPFPGSFPILSASLQRELIQGALLALQLDPKPAHTKAVLAHLAAQGHHFGHGEVFWELKAIRDKAA